MSKTEAKANTTEPQAEAPVVTEVTLDEFCQRHSQSDRRIELIAGFHAGELAAGRHKDCESVYAARFLDFVNKPV